MAKIDLKLAKEMVSNYGATRKKIIDPTYQINDTTSIWFSKDQLTEFVADLQTFPNLTGVRIYLGAYDTTSADTPNQTTIIAIGTVNIGGDDVDAIGGQVAETDAPAARNAGKLCPPVCSPPPPPPPNI